MAKKKKGLGLIVSVAALGILYGVYCNLDVLEKQEETEMAAVEENTEETELVYSYYKDGNPVDENNFLIFYNKLILLQAQSRMITADVNADDISGDPVLILEFTDMDGEVQKLSYYDSSDGLYTVICEPGLAAKVNKLEVDEILENYLVLE